MVRSLDEEKWKMVRVYAGVYGGDSQQLRLLELLRGQSEYEPELEKRAFAGSNLMSMRHTAKRWLVRIVAKLGFYEEGLDAVMGELQSLIRWGRQREAWEWLSGAKLLAAEQEEFEKLGWILQQEYQMAPAMVSVEELDAYLGALLGAIAENTGWIKLKTEVQQYAQAEMESSRRKFFLNGVFPYEAHHADTVRHWDPAEEGQWPISILLEKLRVDEYVLYTEQDYAGAAKLARKSLGLIEQNGQLASRLAGQYAKVLLRYASYQVDLGEPGAYPAVLEKLKDAMSGSGENRLVFGRKYLLLLFHFGFDGFDHQPCSQALEELPKLQASLLDSLESNDSFMVVLCASIFLASQGRIAESMPMVGSMVLKGSKEGPLALMVLEKVVHLIHLLETEDRVGLESYGTNYRRFLKRQQAEGGVGYQLVVALSRLDNLEKATVKTKTKKQVIELVNADYDSENPQLRPFHWPLTEWAKQW